MKNTYYYEHDYYPLEEVKDVAHGVFNRRYAIYGNRDQLDRSLPYYMNCISIHLRSLNIEKFNLGIDYAPPQYMIEDRCENRLVMNFILSGKGRIGNEEFSAGEFYYSLPLEKHTLIAEPSDPWVSVWLAVSGKYIGELLQIIKEKSAKHIIPFKRRNDVLAITETLLYNTELGNASEEYLMLLLQMYLSYVVEIKDSDPPELLTTPKKAKIVRNAKRFISDNLATVTVAQIAERLHYERKYFSRIFTEVVGMPPQDYIVDRKMEWVKNMLVQTKLSVNEIMEAVGYEHRNGLASAFRKKYGCSPSEYRKQFSDNMQSEEK